MSVWCVCVCVWEEGERVEDVVGLNYCSVPDGVTSSHVQLVASLIINDLLHTHIYV